MPSEQLPVEQRHRDARLKLMGIFSRLIGTHYAMPVSDEEPIVQFLARYDHMRPSPSGDDVEVRMVETVTGDFYSEPGEPFWRIEIDGYCADFDSEGAAQNFASRINYLVRRAAIAAMPAPSDHAAGRREGIEEAVKCAETTPREYIWNIAEGEMRERIAAALRALLTEGEKS